MNAELDRWLNGHVRPELRALQAYPVPDATGLIKLDAMENPFAWPEEILGDWLTRLRHVPLNRYPDPAARQLSARIRESWQIDERLDLLLGNGSDELIQLIAMTFSGKSRTMLTPSPGFVMYAITATTCGYRFCPVPLADDFSLDRDTILAAIEQEQPALVFIAYPNNPTGNCFDPATIRAVAHANPGLTVIDEAYAPFADHSFLSEIGTLERTILIRTFSKMGFAGLRLGVMIGEPAIVNQVNRLRTPYNINSLTQASLEFALTHRDRFDQQMFVIKQEREALRQRLRPLPGIVVYPSQANFLLIRLLEKSADDVCSALKNSGILIKNLHSQGGALTQCVRASIGTPQENSALAEAFEQAVG